MEEQWRPIPGYEGWYEVSDQGNIASLARETTRGKLLKPQISSKGYRQVGLSKYGRVKIRRVSNLVLEAFRGPRPPGQEACHGPAGQLDDSLGNLRWDTRSENQLDRRRFAPARPDTSNQGERAARSKLTNEIVLECRRRYTAGETQSALAAEFGVGSGAMNRAIHGHTWSHLTEGTPDPDIDGRSLISTPDMRERRREYGRRGAAKRWHEKSPPPRRKTR